MPPEKDHLLNGFAFLQMLLQPDAVLMGTEDLAEGLIGVSARSENESGVLGLQVGFLTLTFSADVIIWLTQRQPLGRGVCVTVVLGLLPRPVKGGNSEDIPFE